MGCSNLSCLHAAPLPKLVETPLFSKFEEAVLARFTAAARPLSHKKGQVLFLKDDPAESFYFIEQGWMKLFQESLDGKEVILDVLPAGHVFGETAIFAGDVYPYSAEIIEDAKLLVLPLALLKQQLQKDSGMALTMLNHLSAASTKKDREIEHLTLQNAPQRIGCFLLRLCKADASGSVTLHLPYDKTLIAARLGMQPETFSRSLLRLQQDVDLSVRGATVEIRDLEQLVAYTCSACSGAFPCQDMTK